MVANEKRVKIFMACPVARIMDRRLRFSPDQRKLLGFLYSSPLYFRRYKKSAEMVVGKTQGGHCPRPGARGRKRKATGGEKGVILSIISPQMALLFARTGAHFIFQNSIYPINVLAIDERSVAQPSSCSKFEILDKAVSSASNRRGRKNSL